MRKIKGIKNKLALTFFYLLILIVFWLLGISCLFKCFLGIECIGCGMTRAFLSALKLDFKTAFAYHPMFWSVPILYLFFLFDGKLTGRKIPDLIIFIIICIGFILNMILKLI